MAWNDLLLIIKTYYLLQNDEIQSELSIFDQEFLY